MQQRSWECPTREFNSWRGAASGPVEWRENGAAHKQTSHANPRRVSGVLAVALEALGQKLGPPLTQAGDMTLGDATDEPIADLEPAAGWVILEGKPEHAGHRATPLWK